MKQYAFGLVLVLLPVAPHSPKVSAEDGTLYRSL